MSAFAFASFTFSLCVEFLEDHQQLHARERKFDSGAHGRPPHRWRSGHVEGTKRGATMRTLMSIHLVETEFRHHFPRAELGPTRAWCGRLLTDARVSAERDGDDALRAVQPA